MAVPQEQGSAQVKCDGCSLPMILMPALLALRILLVLALVWKIALARIFIRARSVAGRAWAWRIVRLVHALPYVMGCYLAGVVWVWDKEVSPQFGGAACAGVMAAFACGLWLREWWRG